MPSNAKTTSIRPDSWSGEVGERDLDLGKKAGLNDGKGFAVL
jgi:hypothetical protein